MNKTVGCRFGQPFAIATTHAAIPKGQRQVTLRFSKSIGLFGGEWFIEIFRVAV